MPTPKRGARIGGSAHNQKRILSNLAAALFEHGAIKTTDARAKLLRPFAEKLITKAKSGTVADRRLVMAQVPQKDVVAYLFDELAPKFAGREGGYTRSIKLENRSGDNAPMTQISLVLEETVSTEATRATRAAASRKATEDADIDTSATPASEDNVAVADTEPVEDDSAVATDEQAVSDVEAPADESAEALDAQKDAVEAEEK